MPLGTVTPDQESKDKVFLWGLFVKFRTEWQFHNMKKVVKITVGASLPESGAIARVVEFEDGWGQIQTYSRREKAWVKGGSSIQSLLTAEDLTREMLEQMNYDEEDIEKIFWKPDSQEAR